MSPENSVEAPATGPPPPPLPAAAPFPSPAPAPGPLLRALRGLASAADWTIGLLFLVLGLAVLSVAPGLGFLSLGYLLHASGRVAATGWLRSGFPGVRRAAVLGRCLAGAWVAFLPARLVVGLWRDAELVAPGSQTAQTWRIAAVALASLAALHVLWAWLRGGRLRHFLWPEPVRFLRWLRAPGKLPAIRRQAADYLLGLRLPYLLWLGARGFAGAFLWLALPVALLFAAAQLPPDEGGGLLSLLGALLLALAVPLLPFLQTHFAVERRFRAMFEVRTVRRMFARAPVAFWIALLATLLFALPLYLLKIELPPRGAAWLPSLLFVALIYPARLLAGWAVGRARRREQPRHWFFRWTARFAIVPVALVYVVAVYLTQYLSWHGTLSLLEQHAFMLPAPLMHL